MIESERLLTHFQDRTYAAEAVADAAEAFLDEVAAKEGLAILQGGVGVTTAGRLFYALNEWRMVRPKREGVSDEQV